MAVTGDIEPGSFRVSLTHLPRRPGNMWESDLEFVAPPELEVGMAKVVPASKMPAQIRIESVLDGVLVNLDFDFEVAIPITLDEHGDEEIYPAESLYPIGLSMTIHHKYYSIKYICESMHLSMP